MFWDFITLRPETTHQVSFLFSDRGIPDGHRHMNGYGSHTFKLVNKEGKAVYCKFHYKVYMCIRKWVDARSENDLWRQYMIFMLFLFMISLRLIRRSKIFQWKRQLSWPAQIQTITSGTSTMQLRTVTFHLGPCIFKWWHLSRLKTGGSTPSTSQRSVHLFFLLWLYSFLQTFLKSDFHCVSKKWEFIIFQIFLHCAALLQYDWKRPSSWDSILCFSSSQCWLSYL